MNRFLFSIPMFLGLLISWNTLDAQTISSFPYTQDFETFSTCSDGCGANCVLPAASGWVNAPDAPFGGLPDNLDWLTDTDGSSSSNTGPDVDHTLGTNIGKYLYIESSCDGIGHSNKSAFLISPKFDFTGLNAPQMEFWYHMYGASMGLMHIDVSIDDGVTWTNDIVPARTDNRNEWQFWDVDLNSYAGEADVRIRVRGITGTSFGSDMAVDDFHFYDLIPDDAGVSEIITPGAPTCTFGLIDV
ncbi:MAG: hypothetical protein AB8F95_13065, partial [Bacteroidia bacterium]